MCQPLTRSFHPGHLPHSVPQILINRDPVTHAAFDVHLLGDGDTIVKYLCDRLAAVASPVPPLSSGWDLDERVPPLGTQLSNVLEEALTLPAETVVPDRVSDSHVWLFPGANGGRWVDAVRQVFDEDLNGDSGSNQGDGAEKLEVPAGMNSRSRTRSPESGGEREEGKKAKLD